MTVVSVKTAADRAAKADGSRTERDPTIMRVELSDGALFSFKIVYLPPDYDVEAMCVPDRELSAEEAASLRYAAACFRAERAALQLVARAEQTCFGVSRKLEHRGHEQIHVRAAVTFLAGLEIISDQRFAELWLRSRIRRSGGTAPPSPRRLLTGLLGRGISVDIARKALKAALDFESESAMLRNYVNKNNFDPEKKDSSIKYQLKNEGFSQAAIQAFWEEL
jgi:regulatory protein